VTEGEFDATDWSTAYLLARLQLLRARVEAVVAARRKTDFNPDDPFRGLYVDDAEVDRLLAVRDGLSPHPPPDPEWEAAHGALEERATAVESDGAVLRLRQLRATFELEPLDIELLLVGIAPDLDPTFERLYGYLNDDVTRRRASTGLALELCGASLTDGWARSRVAKRAPLIAGGLVSLEDEDRPFLGRSVRVPDRVVEHLLGRDEPDPQLIPLLVQPAPWPMATGPTLARVLAAGVTLLYAQEAPGSAALSYMAAGLAGEGSPVVAVDLAQLHGGEDIDHLAAAASREARLRGAALVVNHVEAVGSSGPGAVRRWADAPGIVALSGSQAWDPSWSARPPFLVDLPRLREGDQVHSWLTAFPEPPQIAELWPTIGAYRLTPEQVRHAAQAAVHRALSRGDDVEGEDLQAGARGQNAAGLEKLARRISPRATWEDLVLPRAVASQLSAIAGRVRQRGRVLDDWRLGSNSSRGRGVTVLFAGDSGTGKTMSAEVVAHSLGLDLYVIDLSSVVDKYIGETEKNLDKIFVEAERVNGVLLFDEADAIFGKRSEVKDARDRYANVEVAYLLQRMEQFEGVAVLTTNLRANVDEAFLRRIDVLVEFPMPDPDSRHRLWSKQLNPTIPVAGDVDFEFLATSFELSGGNIRNVVLAAAFEAAEANDALSMSHLIRAMSAEYRKLGRLCVEAEFGPYYAELLMT